MKQDNIQRRPNQLKSVKTTSKCVQPHSQTAVNSRVPSLCLRVTATNCKFHFKGRLFWLQAFVVCAPPFSSPNSRILCKLRFSLLVRNYCKETQVFAHRLAVIKEEKYDFLHRDGGGGEGGRGWGWQEGSSDLSPRPRCSIPRISSSPLPSPAPTPASPSPLSRVPFPLSPLPAPPSSRFRRSDHRTVPPGRLVEESASSAGVQGLMNGRLIQATLPDTWLYVVTAEASWPGASIV